MSRPIIHANIDGQITQREMTEEEYAELVASGWTETAPIVEEEPAIEE